MNMIFRKFLLFSLFLLPVMSQAQILGVAGQWTDFKKSQFVASSLIPLWSNEGTFSYRQWAIGLEYTTSGTDISGLNLKGFSYGFSPEFLQKNKGYDIMFNMDAGYNINLTHGDNGFVVGPSILLDCLVVYSKIGYDYDLTNKQGQFYIRFGIGLGRSLEKNFNRAKSPRAPFIMDGFSY